MVLRAWSFHSFELEGSVSGTFNDEDIVTMHVVRKESTWAQKIFIISFGRICFAAMKI